LFKTRIIRHVRRRIRRLQPPPKPQRVSEHNSTNSRRPILAQSEEIVTFPLRTSSTFVTIRWTAISTSWPVVPTSYEPRVLSMEPDTGIFETKARKLSNSPTLRLLTPSLPTLVHEANPDAGFQFVPNFVPPGNTTLHPPTHLLGSCSLP
jgi:hypothetical protein